MISSMRIEIKIILLFVAFTLCIVLFERYQVSENVFKQFRTAKISKNRLLVNTITPIVTLNISLGLHEANSDYIDQIARENADVRQIKLYDGDGNVLHYYVKSSEVSPEERNALNFSTRHLKDSLTEERIGVIEIDFFDDDYQSIMSSNSRTMVNIFLFTFAVMVLFIVLIKRELKGLRTLSDEVLKYDPQVNRFSLKATDRKDEIGVVSNAIVNMVERIDHYSRQLLELNTSLEEKVKDRTKLLETANEQLERLSMTDELTKLPNRRHFDQYYEKVWDWARRDRKPLSVVMCDIDWFKQINDTYGHAAGDIVLENVAQILKKVLKRKTDFAARIGGEEFVIVLYDMNQDDAYDLCENIRSEIERMGSLEYHGSHVRPATISLGLSSQLPSAASTAHQLLTNADTALYEAKRRGRNRTVVYEPGT